MIHMFVKKTMLALMGTLLVFAMLPVNNTFAQGENPPRDQPSIEKLEKAWGHQLEVYAKLGRVFEDTDTHLARAQARIDKLTGKGRDASTLQAALNAFAAALERSRPTYNDISQLVQAHAGFDATGTVTDPVLAQTTLQSVRTKLQGLKTSMAGTGKALREAIRAFREAKKPAEGTPAPRDS